MGTCGARNNYLYHLKGVFDVYDAGAVLPRKSKYSNNEYGDIGFLTRRTIQIQNETTLEGGPGCCCMCMDSHDRTSFPVQSASADALSARFNQSKKSALGLVLKHISHRRPLREATLQIWLLSFSSEGW